MPQMSDEDQVADDAALLGSTQLSGKHFTKEGPQSPRPLPCAWTSQRRQVSEYDLVMAIDLIFFFPNQAIKL